MHQSLLWEPGSPSKVSVGSWSIRSGGALLPISALKHTCSRMLRNLLY